MMLPTLRDMCKAAVLKYGVEPRSDLPDTLPAEMNDMEMRMKLDISGHYYTDYHIPSQHACQVDIDWSHGKWTFTMKHKGVRHLATVKAGRSTYLGYEWKMIFLFTNSKPFPGHQDIVIHNFNIELDQRSVVFHGRFYNQHSGNLCQFQTRFSFSITSHLLKLQTAVMTGGICMVVARRFLSQPDTPDYDFLR